MTFKVRMCIRCTESFCIGTFIDLYFFVWHYKFFAGQSRESPTAGLNLGEVLFNYKVDIPNHNPQDHFIFDRIMHQSEDLDYAILKIIPTCTTHPTFPAPITSFMDVRVGQSMYIIGHPDGKPMSEDACVVPLQRGPELAKYIESLQEASKKEFGQDDYVSLHDPAKVLFHTCFTFGSSGSPGIVIDTPDEPVVVVMIQGGTPKTYYESDVKTQQELNKIMTNACFIEYGISMLAIYNDMQNYDDAIRNLSMEIFPYGVYYGV